MDPLYTTSDSELPTVESESEEEIEERPVAKESVDDSFIDKFKRKGINSFAL